ncbi:hypothetical protein [Halorubrum vacuolatum]|uniref:Uncharacterized protein n=1 Tax=Halorubrum vacuolatum TaxID=63740 RepID=A0A238WF86_HALVU|nr:hypothetical protein [Halorubrum vacuolatum]SNR45240.1 hypothetical protein SAMN06264855_107103 [Halorubrum vacuolatum]
MPKDVEKCGRCSASTVVDVAQMDKTPEEIEATDPFADDRIEVDEDELRRVSPAAWIEGIKTRVDRFGTRLMYNK